jgi:hypothetical protein
LPVNDPPEGPVSVGLRLNALATICPRAKKNTDTQKITAKHKGTMIHSKSGKNLPWPLQYKNSGANVTDQRQGVSLSRPRHQTGRGIVAGSARISGCHLTTRPPGRQLERPQAFPFRGYLSATGVGAAPGEPLSFTALLP